MDDDTRKDETPKDPATAGRNRYLIWIGVFLVLLLVRFLVEETSAPKYLAYTEFKAELEAGRVAAVTTQGQQLFGELVSEEGAAASSTAEIGVDLGDEPEPAASRFVTNLPPFEDPELWSLLEEHGVKVDARPAESWLSPLVLGFLPLLLLVGLFLYTGRIMRQQLGDVGSRLTGFGQSKAKRYRHGESEVTFDDVAGLENAKNEVREIVDYLTAPEKFQRLGIKVPRGVLLMGPPGTGKTLLARATAGEAGVPFFSISGSEFVELFVGVGASRVRDMFNDAKREAPAIIFIDEIDSVGRARGTGLGGGHDEREQTLNQILAEMDGFESEHTVVMMAATNRPDVLDPALLRPGRFDRKITLDLPHKQARQKILEVHSREVPLSETVDLAEVAAGTVGFSGADLENLVNEAALLAARQDKTRVDREDFDNARERILFGNEREDLIVESEQRITAYHESGHALVAWLLPGTDLLKKVTIIPRGRALGLTEQVPEEDRHHIVRSYLMNRIAVILGGRAAEKVVFGEVSTGAEQDLKQVTQLARRMVCQWGMSDKLAPVAFRHGEEHVFLGREMGQAKDFSEHTAQILDEEVSAIALEMESKAIALLKENRALLDALAEALVEHETLEREEIDALLLPLKKQQEERELVGVEDG